MIDIQPHLDKLDRLKEYMDKRVEYQPIDVWMDLQVCPDSFYLRQGLPLPKPYKKIIRFFDLTFEEYLQLNN
jgi:hypothetical protein